ncbi:hypothetical protein ACHAXA_001783 [Cyclostephanos tholiformis]|uniref:Uncharacterized protein n=1 Tax=Cyclostephanos tholiformis TaxID=382380 RepID=A0ABD3RXN8_9STRA
MAMQAFASARICQEYTSSKIVINGGGDGSGNGSGSGMVGNGDGGGEEYVVDAIRDDPTKVIDLIRALLALELWRERVLFDDGRNGRNGEGGGGDGGDGGGVDEGEGDGGGRSTRGVHHDVDEVYDDGGGTESEEGLCSSEGGGGRKDTRRGGGGGLAYRLAHNGNALRTSFIMHVFLGTPEESNPALRRQRDPPPVAHRLGRTRYDEIRDASYDTAYKSAIASVSLSRYLMENANCLGFGLLSRILEVHDFPLLMARLIEEPPWTRRRTIIIDPASSSSSARGRRSDGTGSNGEANDSSTTRSKTVWEKLDDNNEWREVRPTDLLKLTRLEGEPWLAIFHVIASGTCRESYRIDEYRRSRLMRLRGYMNETLIEQLPVLVDVARYLDELSLLGGGEFSSSYSSLGPSLLRRVDTLRESIAGGRMLDEGHWATIANAQWDEIFSRVTDTKDEDLRRIAVEVYDGAIGDANHFDIAGDAASEEYASSPIDDEGNDGPEMDGHGRIAEDWREALSKPIEKVLLQFTEDGGENGDSVSTFELVPAYDNDGAAGNVAITDTPLGPFRRRKMFIIRAAGDGEAIYPHAKAVAHVRFRNDTSITSSLECNPGEIMLSMDSLLLPTVVRDDAFCDRFDEVGIELPESTFRPKEWRQLGDVERRSIVLQLGFRRLSRGMVPAGSTLLRGYILSQAFVSQPHINHT